MAKPKIRAGGGLAALRYTWEKGREAGGFTRLYRRLRSRNTCKTCAFGMGGQRGGMVNESGQFPEVCKKSIQAVVADLQGPIPGSYFERHAIADLEKRTPREMENLGRLAFPLIAESGDTHFRRIDWEQALDRVAGALRDTPPSESFFYASGRSSNEAAFLLQSLARAYGTTNIHNCSCYCHNASGVALGRAIGSGTATVVLEDLDRTDLAVLAGANPASNHPRLIVKLAELKKRGGTVIVVNPVRELGLQRFRIPSKAGSMLFGSDICDLYLQPHVGGDVALFKGILKELLAAGHGDASFLREHVSGWDAVVEDLDRESWDDLVADSGVPRDLMREAAAAIGRARRGMVLWAMGLTHHVHGVDNIAALVNVALARGWLGRPGCGLMPIRGHSNIQGVGSVGFTPVLKKAFAERMEAAYGIPATTEIGLDTYGSMEAAHAGRIRTAVLLGGNLYGSSPDLAWAAEAMQRIGTTVHITTKLNPGHVMGRGRVNLVLPVLARDEENQPTTQESMFNFVRMSDGGQAAPAGEIRSEVEVVCALAARMLPPGPFPFGAMTDHRSIRQAIANVVPGWARIGSIDESRHEFHIDGRTFHEPRFPTPDGKARATVTPRPPFRPGAGEFRLMTLRSEGQFNTVVYEEEDLYRGIDRRDVVMMHAGDGASLGVREGDPVVVETETGRMTVVAAFIDIPPGNLAMYYPEANAVVPRRIDPRSGTPAFKSVVARVRPA